MSDKIETLRVLADIAFGRLDHRMEGLTEEELDWQSCEEANHSIFIPFSRQPY